MTKLQLALLCCVMSPIVSFADLAIFSVGKGMEPPIPVLNLLHGGIYRAIIMQIYLKHPVE